MPRDFKSRPTVNGAQIGLLSEAGAGISGTFSFAPTASIERHRITDSNVLTNSYILGELRRPVVAEVDDYGWEYDANVVEVGAGYFDIEVETSILGEIADDEFTPNPDYYLDRSAASFQAANATSFGGDGSSVSFLIETAIPFVVNTSSKIRYVSVEMSPADTYSDNPIVKIERDSGGLPSDVSLVTGELHSDPNFIPWFARGASANLTPTTLIPGNYWLVLGRSGAADNANLYSAFLQGRGFIAGISTNQMGADKNSVGWTLSSGRNMFPFVYRIGFQAIQPGRLETLNYDYFVI